MEFEVTYIKRYTFVLNAENNYDAANLAERSKPEGYELSDWCRILTDDHRDEVLKKIQNNPQL